MYKLNDGISNALKLFRVPEKKPTQTFVMDGVEYDVTDPRSVYAITQQKIVAANAVQQFAELSSEDLEDGDTLCDMFFAQIASNCDLDNDGELSKEEEEDIYQIYCLAAEYMVQYGARPEDVEAFINDDDEQAAANIQEMLRNVLPDGEDDCLDDIDDFAFSDGDGSTESVLDSSEQSVMDAVYKRRRVIRNGRKVIIRKRISGRVRLTAKQKMAVRKMHRKSHTGKANMRRKKSMRKRISLGMNK